MTQEVEVKRQVAQSLLHKPKPGPERDSLPGEAAKGRNTDCGRRKQQLVPEEESLLGVAAGRGHSPLTEEWKRCLLKYDGKCHAEEQATFPDLCLFPLLLMRLRCNCIGWSET